MTPLKKKWFKKQWAEKHSQKNAPSHTSAPKPLLVSDYLLSDTIRFFQSSVAQQQIFTELIRTLQLENAPAVLKAILEREEIGSTVIAREIAFPHTRLPNLTRTKAALGLCPKGAEGIAKESPIRLFLLFVSPADNMSQHLAFLSSAASLFQTEDLAQHLLRLTAPEAILEKIRESETGR